MSIDTYLIVPVQNPATAARLLSDSGDEVVHVGPDFLVVYKGDLFAGVAQAPGTWGPIYAQDLPPSLRRRLDPRGLLAVPEVGQSFESKSYAEVVGSEQRAVWLPLRRLRRQRTKRVLLVALSPAREAMLLERPELVADLISNRAAVPIPGSIEFNESWIDLQRLLLDCLWLEGTDDGRADALAPRSGLSLYEDETIDSARLLRADQARSTATWLATVTPEVVERARLQRPSPASRSFPESLGSAPADDSDPLPETRRGAPKVNATAIDEELKRLFVFYQDVRGTGRSIVAIRFRE